MAESKSNRDPMTPIPLELVGRLERTARQKDGDADVLAAVPDTRAFEDGSTLGLHIRIERLREEATLLREAAAAHAQQTEEIDALRTELEVAKLHEHAFNAIKQAITDAVGDSDPSGPYWEDGVRWLQQQREAAEAERDQLRAELERR